MSIDPEDLDAVEVEELSAEDIEQEALRQERDWYLSEDGFLDFARDCGAAPQAQYEPHGKYAHRILSWNGEPDPDSPGRIIYKFKMVLWPRGSFKSSVFDVAQVCWLIARDQNVRILVASETGKQARKFVAQAMAIIDSEWFKIRFGTHRGKKWKDGEFYSALRTDKHKREPTLIAAGVGEVWTGAHWDFVVMDDVVGKENSTTIQALEGVWEWFGEVLAQLDPGCKLLVIGTLWHHADIYCKLMNDPEKSKLFEMSIHAWQNDDGSLFFPGRLTPTFVGNQKKLMSSRQFACFYENRPFSDEEQIFKPSYFQVIEDHEIPTSVWTYIFTDFAFVTDEQTKGRPDRTCFWVISLDCNRVAYVRDFYVGKWKPDDSVRLCCTLWNDAMQAGWNPRGVVVEKTTHADLLSTIFKYVKRETFIDPKFILIGGRSQQIKEIRIEASEPRWKRGDIYFSRSVRQQYENKWRPMFREMTQWPLSEYDDIPDAQSDIDKRDENGKYYCPSPPPGWRAPVGRRQHPVLINGQFNPNRGYPAQEMLRAEQLMEGHFDSWLGKSSSMGATSGQRPRTLQPANSDIFSARNRGDRSIYGSRSSPQKKSDALW